MYALLRAAARPGHVCLRAACLGEVGQRPWGGGVAGMRVLRVLPRNLCKTET